MEAARAEANMSPRHPVIAITGSSGAGTTTVTTTFQQIFRREGVKAVIVYGDAFHRWLVATLIGTANLLISVVTFIAIFKFVPTVPEHPRMPSGNDKIDRSSTSGGPAFRSRKIVCRPYECSWPTALLKRPRTEGLGPYALTRWYRGIPCS
jgi:Phosphoribulokinase / Uridine kinase family